MPYCTNDDVESLFGDLSDDVTEPILETSINNGTAWIDTKLTKHFIPIPTTEVSALKTACIYYSASDILYSLYHGEEYQSQYDLWFQKAQEFLDDYIEAYNNSEAEASDLVSHQMVKHSHGRTYNQKRCRRGVRRWVR